MASGKQMNAGLILKKYKSSLFCLGNLYPYFKTTGNKIYILWDAAV